MVNVSVSRTFWTVVLAAGLVAACDGATDPAGRGAALRPGVYALVAVNGAPVPTATPDGPTARIDSGKLTVTAPDTVAFEQTITVPSTIFPTQIVQRGSYRARLTGSILTLEPVIAPRTLIGTVGGDTIRLEVGHPGAPVTNVYVHR